MDSNNINDKIESGEKKGGLRLAGVDTDKMREQAKATEQEVWDFSEGEAIQWVTSAKSAIIRETEENRSKNVGGIILIISQIITYIFIAAEIGCFAYVTTLEPIFLMENIAKYKGVFLACSASLIIDAIIVNVIAETKLFLIVTAWLFPFLYPGMRQAHVKGKFGIGVWVTIFYFLSLCGFLAFAGNQAMYYGGILKVEDAGTKKVAAELLEQPTEKGETVGKLFSTYFSVDEVTVSKKGAVTKVVFSGKGLIYYSNDMLIRGVKKSIPTKMVFVLDGSNAEYKISEITAGDVELTDIGVESYWKQMIQ